MRCLLYCLISPVVFSDGKICSDQFDRSARLNQIDSHCRIRVIICDSVQSVSSCRLSANMDSKVWVCRPTFCYYVIFVAVFKRIQNCKFQNHIHKIVTTTAKLYLSFYSQYELKVTVYLAAANRIKLNGIISGIESNRTVFTLVNRPSLVVLSVAAGDCCNARRLQFSYSCGLVWSFFLCLMVILVAECHFSAVLL